MSSDSDPPKLDQAAPSLVADLQAALLARRPAADDPSPPEPESGDLTSAEAESGNHTSPKGEGGNSTAQDEEVTPPALSSSADVAQAEASKPVVLVTSADGINSPGLEFLVRALVSGGLCDVSVVAPESEKPASGQSITVSETVIATSTEIGGAKAFQISGTPSDCVSLALSGSLFSWSKPALVISGINQGSSCGHQIFHSGAIAGAREALMWGIPSLAISLNWKKSESQVNDLKDAVEVCLPVINAAIKDSKNGNFPKNCFLNIGIPTSPSTNKGWKKTRQSEWRLVPSWHATSASNRQATQFMSMHQSLGLQLAQLGRDASAAGAARRANAQRKNVEVESVAAAGKPETKEVVKKHFRLEFVRKECQEGSDDEDLDFVALENGFITVTPLRLQLRTEPEIQVSISDWLSSALKVGDGSS